MDNIDSFDRKRLADCIRTYRKELRDKGEFAPFTYYMLGYINGHLYHHPSKHDKLFQRWQCWATRSSDERA